ncbi:TPA: hypothetical protein ACVO3F_004670 [Vibrio diabolicus]
MSCVRVESTVYGFSLSGYFSGAASLMLRDSRQRTSFFGAVV